MPGRILIVDDVATNRIVLKVRLTDARYAVLVAEDAETGLRLARAHLPDLILMDGALPDLAGDAAVARLRADPATAAIPVIMMMRSHDTALRLAALQAGADDVMTKPVDETRMMARVRALLRASCATEEMKSRDEALGPIGMTEAPAGFDRPGLVALVAQWPASALHLRGVLSAHMSDRFVIQSRDAALGAAAQPAGHLPDVYVIEADLAEKGGGLRLLSDLRSRSGTRHTAICLLQKTPSEEESAIAFDLGADDVIEAGVEPREIALRLGRLMGRKRRDDALRATLSDGLRLAVIDPLTSLFNRRYALAQLGRVADRAVREERGFAVLVIDIDRFKAVNDVFGHAAGDSVLVEVARRLSANMRAGDLLGRIGGEEFIVALPQTSSGAALALAERLCHAVNEGPVALDETRRIAVTISIGLAVSRPAPIDDPVSDVLARADQALLQAKAAGRNRVTAALTVA
jgi:two-component system cell cycle response regulator